MAVTSIVNGSQLTVINTEHDLMAANTTSGVFVCMTDLNPMANGDVVELRIYTRINAQTERLAYYAVYAHAQAQPNKYSVPVPSLGGATETVHYTLKQTAGSVRTFFYRVVTVG